jgi:glycine oxidase
MKSPDVLVVGGGVIGLTTAYYLAREGMDVCVVDAGPFGRQASWAGAGILPPANAAHAQTPLDHLRACSVAAYPHLSATLREETSIDNGYRLCGGIELPEPGQSPADLPTDEYHSPGVTAVALSQSDLQERSGWRVEAPFGVHLLELAQVRNPWHLRALEAACRARGVDLRPDWPVRRLDNHGVEGDRGRLSASWVVVTSGAWTGNLLPLPIRPIRGQMLLLRVTPALRPILACGKRYLVPREDGRVLVGSTEEAVGFDSQPTATALAELHGFALGLCPELAEAPIEAQWAGLRPASGDGMPYIGFVPRSERILVAAGHFRAGLQLAPATAEMLVAMILGRPTPLDPSAFRLDR